MTYKVTLDGKSTHVTARNAADALHKVLGTRGAYEFNELSVHRPGVGLVLHQLNHSLRYRPCRT